ncbi:MAG: peptidase [Proteobacteria bacterium]|nr:peptidase [Pseudomonadota bacterium]
MTIRRVFMISLATLLGLSACGGGGGGQSSSLSNNNPPASTYTKGVFLQESTFAGKCAAPRSGTDPVTHAAYPDTQGTSTDENNWLRSWTNDLYLWYSEVPDLDPSGYQTVDYFPLLKTSATTTSGAPKDKFHFTEKTSDWESLSQSNVDVGYGVQFEVLSPTVPRQIVVAYTEAGSAASQAPLNVARGAVVLAIDGNDVNTGTQAGVDALNAGLSPAQAGETHTFQIQDAGATTSRSVTLTSATVTTHSVGATQTFATATGTVGYLLFNNQLAQAETQLVDAINTLKSAGVTDLVLDMRYNGGGYLDIASELAYMIAGPQMTSGQTFELIQFNSKHPSTDPVTGSAITPTPFLTTTQGLSVTRGQALPTLNLPRVFVLTTSGTCSASEAVMNSLQGVGVQVVQVGTTTCGKPYGFYPQDNCGTTYFSIQFQGVNARNFGGYSDGFKPDTGTTTSSGTSNTLPGCVVHDDFTHALGDQNESLLFSALSYRATQSCGTPPAGSLGPDVSVKLMERGQQAGYLVRSPMREIRILRP